MKGVRILKAGSLDDLDFGTLPEPAPAADELLIAVKAAGINPADWKIIERGFEGWTFPKAAGLDAAGIVLKAGAETSGFREGDRVFYHSRFATLGSFAERAVIPHHVVAKMPVGLSFAAAAALPTAGFTAYQVIEERFRLNDRSLVLIHAGAGALGGMAIQLAKRRGAKVITTCSPNNNEWVTTLGADYVIDYHTCNIGEEVRRISSGRGVDAVLDAIGPPAGEDAIDILAFQGHLACCVGLPDFSKIGELPRGIQISDIALGWAYLRDDRRAQERLAYYGEQLGTLVAQGEINPMIMSTIRPEQIIDALHHVKTGKVRGKIVAVFDTQEDL